MGQVRLFLSIASFTLLYIRHGRQQFAESLLRKLPVLCLLPAVSLVVSCAGVVSANKQVSAAPQQASFSLSSGSITFGNVTVGKPATQSISVTNTGAKALNITQVTLSNAQFGVTGLTMPLALAVGQSSSFTVTVDPSAAGTLTGTLTVTGDSGTTPAIASLSATGVTSSTAQPALTITPASATFGNVTVGSSSTQTIQLTNSGTAALSITQASVTGAGFSAASLALPISLAAGQSTSFSLKFAPTASGAVTGGITVASNAPNSPAVIALSGDGVASTLTLSYSATTLTFGNVNTGSSAALPVTVTNTGNANVQISQLAENGAGFTLTNASTPVTLSPNQSLTFDVHFNPSAAGSDTGSVTVTSNATGSPKTISLSGTGVAATSYSVALNWAASTSTVSGYNVYRSTTTGSGYSKLNGALVSNVTYTDTSVQSGVTYYYVTTSVDSSGNESSYSNQATAAIP